jgi:low temperature requirement protein LtrA
MSDPVAGSAWRAWFLQPPRRHGEAIEHRAVSPLELLYDLVYVVCFGQAAHTLAGDVSWGGALDFAAVFGLIWLAWMNGSLHHELHGRNDGRSRLYVFLQMLVLAVLAVFTGHAADGDGRGFAIVYALLLALLTWLWYEVRRADRGEYRDVTTRYLAGMVMMIVVMAASAALPDGARVGVWAGLVIVFTATTARTFALADAREIGVTITESMVERFGLLVIIVLGEVVIGVVDGMSEAPRDAVSIATGTLGLVIGFGLWWNYFDFAGSRLPREQRGGFGLWVFAHMPLAAAVAASGAGMVSLVAHAHESRAPAASAWLLAVSVAVMLLAVAAVLRSLRERVEQAELHRVQTIAIVVAAGVALVLGWARPKPWLLALGLAAVLAGPWVVAFVDRARLGSPMGASTPDAAD